MVSYLNTMQGINVVRRYNTFLAKQSISKAIQASKSRSRTLLTLCIGAAIASVEATTSVQYKASIQVYATILLPGEQWRVLMNG